jgi:hypothetical protein
MSEKTSAEEPNLRQQIMMELNQQYVLGHQQGQLVGYARGKAEAEKRIWGALEKHSIRGGGWIEETLADLKQIIFGGGDDNK